MNLEILTKYYEAGLSLLPINSVKKPTVNSWVDRQKNPVKPNGEFSNGLAQKVALVCGRVSGGIEAIDFDTKWDLSGKLMKDFKVTLENDDLIRRLVIQKSPSGGYHFFYRCEEISGNKKLARKETTKEEREKNNSDQKVAGLIETRGEGGYILIEPSAGYKIIQGDLFHIPVITTEERELLHECAKSFNLYVPNNPDYKQRNFAKKDGNSPFELFNEKFDVVDFLVGEGWAVVKEYSEKIQLRRPGKTEGVSATYWIGSKVFYPFTTSSEFEPERGCNPVKVYTTLKCNNDYSIASAEIRKMGYGEKDHAAPTVEIKSPITTVIPDDVWQWDGTDEYLKSLQDGSFQLGLGMGMKRFNDHFRLKRGNVNVINGHDNVGKTIVLIFMLLISAKYYDWRWVVYLAENSKKFFMRKCIEFLTGSSLRGVDYKIISKWRSFVEDHFFLIDSNGFYTYEEILRMNEHQRSKRKIDGLFIDPYNALKPNYGSQSAKMNMHQYDYEVMNTFRGYSKQNDCCIYLNCHAVTAALRKIDKEGYLIAPNRADTEGGLKFASKADDFLTIHRLTNHPTDWMITDIHVRKIKEQETGGTPTPKDSPLKIQMMIGGVGFVDEYGWNPILEKQFDPIRIANQESNVEIPNEFSFGARPDKYLEPEKEIEYPF